MCPNCVLNTVSLGMGYLFVFVICILFFGTALGWIFWGYKSGHFDNLEGPAKYNVIEDDLIIN